MSATADAVSSAERVRPRWLARLGTYVGLTKPRIIELLLVTTVPAMVLAEGGLPSAWLVLATLAGRHAGRRRGQHHQLRDRPGHRRADGPHPPPAAAPGPGHAGQRPPLRRGPRGGRLLWLWATVNPLSAFLAVGATAFYVFVYTMWLKRTTTQNIVIGGAAGAVPVLVGWSAVTGEVGLPAWIMFAIIFVWTPPHFWALAMRYREDYAQAGVPMLPVVAGPKAAGPQIMAYSVVLVAVTLTLCPAAQMGPVYLVSALVLGARFLRCAQVLRRDDSPVAAIKLFSYSIQYLGLLFAAIAVDTLIAV